MIHPRSVEAALDRRLEESAVVRLSGPRTSGKSTTCTAVIERRGGTTVRLDDLDVRRAVQADPSGYLSGLPAPILVDEYQYAPEVLDVVKADLSRHGGQPGRWLLCGSVSVRAVAPVAESLGGRLSDLVMGTLTLDERNDLPPSVFLERLVTENASFLHGWKSPGLRDRDTLLSEAVLGGFPLVVAQREVQGAPRRVLADWIAAAVISDSVEIGGVRNTEELRRMLRLYAASTGAITPKDTPIADRLEIGRRTAARYRSLLTDLHVTWDLPAFWPGNATGQVTRSPKLHLIDSGLAGHLAGRDSVAALDRDDAFAGQLVETMVANDLRVQASNTGTPLRLAHYREDSSEVDLVIERHDGHVFGVEVKLTGNPGEGSLRGLRHLARSCGDRFAGGVVLARVPAGRPAGHGLTIAPLDAVWDITG